MKKLVRASTVDIDIESVNEIIGDTINRFFPNLPAQISIEKCNTPSGYSIDIYDENWSNLLYSENCSANDIPAELSGYRTFVSGVIERARTAGIDV